MGRYSENYRKFLTITLIGVLLFVLLSVLSHAQTENIYLYVMPRDDPLMRNESLFRFDINNPAPSNMTGIYYYLEFFAYDDNHNLMPNVNVTVELTTRWNMFILADGSNRTFRDTSYDNETFKNSAFTDDNGRFYMIVPHNGIYTLTIFYEGEEYKELNMTPYLYLDYSYRWNGIYLYEYMSLENNSAYLSQGVDGADLSVSLVDSGSKFLIGFLLFVAVLAVPFGVVVFCVWIFKKYFR